MSGAAAGAGPAMCCVQRQAGTVAVILLIGSLAQRDKFRGKVGGEWRRGASALAVVGRAGVAAGGDRGGTQEGLGGCICLRLEPTLLDQLEKPEAGSSVRHAVFEQRLSLSWPSRASARQSSSQMIFVSFYEEFQNHSIAQHWVGTGGWLARTASRGARREYDHARAVGGGLGGGGAMRDDASATDDALSPFPLPPSPLEVVVVVVAAAAVELSPLSPPSTAGAPPL